ncbi:MAG: hypothetical protein QOI31_1004 [Solirubrobacterales bacterium]|jgi:hypothetical protein|nr:hypothetical protein [Solirubrobacterales bacterium]
MPILSIERRQGVRWGLGLACVCLSVFAGFAFGAKQAPDEAEFDQRYQGVYDDVFASSRQLAWGPAVAQGFVRGFEKGADLGARRGSASGKARGSKAAGIALVTQIPAGGRSESRSDIGYKPPEPINPTGGVLVIGDSLEVLTSPYLERYLPRADITVNAVGGYNSIQLFGLFQESFDPSQQVIVFDAGTNDNPNYPQILQSRLQAVANAVGSRCMVVPTIHGLSVGGVDSSGKNRVVEQFAASRPSTQTPDWARVATTRPDLMQSDNLHPTAEGADYRAQLIADGVKGCFATG